MRRIAAVFALLGLATLAPAQEEKIVTLPYDGPDFFCHILFAKGLTPIASFDEALRQPTKTVVIVWGDVNSRAASQFLFNQEESFRKAGGSLFVATDHPMPMTALGVDITGPPVTAFKENCFGHHPLCPWLTYGDAATEEGKLVREHPLFNLLQNRLATNRPIRLRERLEGSALTLMLQLPPRKAFIGSAFKPSYYVAVSPKDTPPRGRVVLLAGHGMFTNGMMLQPGTDNFAFAINAMEWLREGPDGAKRTHALFIVDGQIVTDFNRNLTPPLPPIPMPTVPMVNRLLRGLEDEGFFHWAVQQAMGNSYRNVVPFLIGFGTCLLLFYGAKKFMDARSLRDTRAPRMVGLAAPSNPAEPRDFQRQKALYRQNEAGNEARLLALHWLAAEFSITPEQCAGGALGIQVTGFFLTTWSLRRHADFVVRLACAAGTVEASRSEFVALIHALPRLSKARRSGRLTLLLDGKEVT